MLIYRLIFAFLLVPLLVFANPLEDEIANSPRAAAYALMDDAALLAALNAKDLQSNRTAMTGREVRAAVDQAEYNDLSDAKKSQFLRLTVSDSLDPYGVDAEIIKDIFGAGSTTVSNLATARVEDISQGIKIGWGVVTEKDLRMHTVSRKHPQ